VDSVPFEIEISSFEHTAKQIQVNFLQISFSGIKISIFGPKFLKFFSLFVEKIHDYLHRMYYVIVS
jgi:hypothetical protein